MLYFFILGHNSILSIAEILARLKKGGKNVEKFSPDVLILKDSSIHPSSLQDKLGGTVKIGEIIARASLEKTEKILPYIFRYFPKNAKKIYFGFSIYRLEEGASLAKAYCKIKILALKIKKALKEKDISSRWVTCRKFSLSSVVVRKNRLSLPDQGIEFVLLIGKDKFYLGKSLSWQDFEKEKHFDFGRPKRPIKQGLLPPKLARILINLSQTPKNETLLDPFCGAGTILSEEIRMGYKNIIGADISSLALKQTEENLKWLQKQIKEKINYRLILSDVRNISKKIPPLSVGAIITEPYLGPIKPPKSKSSVSNLTSNLSKLYLAAFEEFKKILKPKGRVVIIFPVFAFQKKKIFISLKDKIKKQGWKIINPLQKLPYLQNQPLIYQQPEQKILREILILQK